MPDRPPSPPLSAPRPSALRPERIAHRGAPREFYENTLDGFVRALERGADAVELDVHKTRDDTVVIHHDADVIVAPNTRAAISTLTWADICAVRLAGGAHIPTLAQVMDAVADRATVFGVLESGEEIDVLPANYRSHGSLYEREVPLLRWGSDFNNDHSVASMNWELLATIDGGTIVSGSDDS